MARIFIVIVAFLYDGIVRGRKLSFEGKLNYWKSLMTKQGAHFHWNGSPFDLKILDFWPLLYPRPSLLSSNPEGWIHWVSPLRGSMLSVGLKSRSAFPPFRSLHIWAFCPTR
jgi:hypothetical protein